MKTFRQLLKENNYKYVFNEIHNLYLKGYTFNEKQEFDLKFYSVWHELEELKGISKKNKKLYLNINKVSEEGREEGIEVCLFDESEDELFALDFIDWNDIIDMKVLRAVNVSDKKCLAHILWEITFWGFSNEKVKEESLKLKNLK